MGIKQTLKDKATEPFDIVFDRNTVYFEEDVKEKLNDFYNDYWKESYIGDKCKKHITCDRLDYLMDKHFASLIEIETLQDLPNQKKIKKNEN